jgi:hypothetical protein
VRPGADLLEEADGWREWNDGRFHLIMTGREIRRELD